MTGKEMAASLQMVLQNEPRQMRMLSFRDRIDCTTWLGHEIIRLFSQDEGEISCVSKTLAFLKRSICRMTDPHINVSDDPP